MPWSAQPPRPWVEWRTWRLLLSSCPRSSQALAVRDQRHSIRRWSQGLTAQLLRARSARASARALRDSVAAPDGLQPLLVSGAQVRCRVPACRSRSCRSRTHPRRGTLPKGRSSPSRSPFRRNRRRPYPRTGSRDKDRGSARMFHLLRVPRLHPPRLRLHRWVQSRRFRLFPRPARRARSRGRDRTGNRSGRTPRVHP